MRHKIQDEFSKHYYLLDYAKSMMTNIRLFKKRCRHGLLKEIRQALIRNNSYGCCYDCGAETENNHSEVCSTTTQCIELKLEMKSLEML